MSFYAENWNKALRHGRIDPENFTPYPKNPLLSRFFVNIGHADKLGSGVRNLYRYTIERITNAAAREYTGKSEESVKRFLRSLTEKRLLEAYGERKTRRYRLALK